MKTLTFILLAFLVSCMVTLNNQKQDLKAKVKELEETILYTDSLVVLIQESNRKYIDIALSCKCKK